MALGPGSVVDPEYLLNVELPEIAAYAKQGMRDRFHIDPMCAVVEDEDRTEGVERINRIGGTGKGTGGATARRVRRVGPIARDVPALRPYLHAASRLSTYKHIIIESAQGFGLSLTRSGFYPYTTSRDVTPGAVLNDAGLPAKDFKTILVLRTFPIRVAGPSGPLANEITWDDLSQETRGYVTPERTTVTNKIRRVGRWDPEIAKAAIHACAPDYIALTFFDYWRPDLANFTTLDMDAYRRLEAVQSELRVPIRWVSTGFQTIIDLNEREGI
jgi:adenylosuccinate synthase